MQSPAPILGTVVLLSTSVCWANEPVIKWRAAPVLDLLKSSSSCGQQYREPLDMEFDGKILKTSAWSRQTYDMELLAPLNADGSGEVNALSMPLHRSMVIRFAPGHGPRTVTFWGRYFSGTGNVARCIYAFVPIEGK
jgi:hypothetical protein